MTRLLKSLTLFILLILHSSVINAFPQLIRIPSGRTLPLSLLTEHFPSRPTAHTIKHVYEITSNFRLIGHDINVSIHSVTDGPEFIRYKPTTILLNGKRIKPSRLNLHIRRGNFRVAHTPGGTVLGLWGPRISLKPVDLVKYPGIYVNSFSSSPHSRFQAEVYDHLASRANRATEMSSRNESRVHGETAIDYSIPFSSRKSTCEKKSKSKMVEFAVAFSSRMCSRYGTFKRTLRALLAFFMFASEPYEYQTCLFFKVVSFDGYCSPSRDPYRNYKQRFTSSTKDQSIKMLGAFSDYWFKNRRSVKRDLAYFIPAFDSPHSTGGVAYLGAVCNKYAGYGWVSTQHPIFLAHEVGHNFNASHSHAGIMSASVDAINPPQYFMSSSAEKISRFAETRNCLGLSKESSLNKQQTCGFKFPVQLGFMCKTTQLPTFSWKTGASVEKQVSLAGDKIEVSLNIKSKESNTKLFRFKRILINVSTNHSSSDLNQVRKYSPLRIIQTNIQRFSKKVSPSALEAQSRWSTCCERQISIFIYVEIEAYKSSKTWSADASHRYSWTLPCISCSTKILPMSANRKCPSCV